MTPHIKQINILDLMEMYGEDSCRALLSTFICPLNLDAEYVIGGKTVYIECNNQPKLFDFYSSSGFLAFDKRNRQGSVNENDVLIQMLKYFNHQKTARQIISPASGYFPINHLNSITPLQKHIVHAIPRHRFSSSTYSPPIRLNMVFLRTIYPISITLL